MRRAREPAGSPEIGLPCVAASDPVVAAEAYCKILAISQARPTHSADLVSGQEEKGTANDLGSLRSRL